MNSNPKIFWVIMLSTVLCSLKLNAQQSPGDFVAKKIAQKMKDTLLLSEQEKLTIYQINMQLYFTKQTKRQTFRGSDSLGIYLQRVENMRDSMYEKVLSEQKFLIYKEKKKNLVNSNQ